MLVCSSSPPGKRINDILRSIIDDSGRRPHLLEEADELGRIPGAGVVLELLLVVDTREDDVELRSRRQIETPIKACCAVSSLGNGCLSKLIQTPIEALLNAGVRGRG